MHSVQVLSGDTFTTLFTIPRQRTACLRFSPKGTFLATWEPFLGKVSESQHSNVLHDCEFDESDMVQMYFLCIQAS
jgi:hypothetical protein